MAYDLWHYPRTDLAKQIFGVFESGLSSALVFFAPRRMGKTEFLRKDMTPLAESCGWQVFYFSFLDVEHDAATDFVTALSKFTEQQGLINKPNSLLKRINKLSAGALGVKAGIELKESNELQHDLKELISLLAKRGKILLLMDEVQALAQEVNNTFIAAFRTALDMHKDHIKVIFTGSSQTGLRQMFSQAKAPFFHFGQNLNFPQLDRGFTDHLAKVFKTITQRSLNNEALWQAFEDLQKVPQLIRALIERLALNPNLDMPTAKAQLLAEIHDDREYVKLWNELSALERAILSLLAQGEDNLFSQRTREHLSKQLGLTGLSSSSTQSSARTLLRKEIIGKQSERSGYFIEDPNFANWVKQLK